MTLFFGNTEVQKILHGLFFRGHSNVVGNVLIHMQKHSREWDSGKMPRICLPPTQQLYWQNLSDNYFGILESIEGL